MGRPWQISRRAALRGVRVSLGLPMLECMLRRGRRAHAAASTPKRLVFFVFDDGTPERARPGCLYPSFGPLNAAAPTRLTKPLANLGLFDDILLIGGLHNVLYPAVPDHAGQAQAILTQVAVQNVNAAGNRADISIDQYAASKLPSPGRVSSLVLGTGYAREGSDYLSWKGPTQPINKIVDPGEVFRTLTGQRGNANPNVLKARKMVLDAVWDDARRLQMRLGKGDQTTLDQYLTGIHELEVGIDRQAQAANQQCAATQQPPASAANLPEQVDLLNKLLTFAFRCDITRVVVLALGWTGQSETYPFLGAPAGQWVLHSQIYHHGLFNDPNDQTRATGAELERRLDAYEQVATWHIEQFGKLIQLLKDAKEPDGGSVLNNTIAICTSEMEYGDGHPADNLPVIVAGGRNLGVNGGRYIWGGNKPIANLYVSLLQGIGIQVPSFGISNGTVALG